MLFLALKKHVKITLINHKITRVISNFIFLKNPSKIMKNIILIILSILIGFALSVFILKSYFKNYNENYSQKNNSNSQKTTKKTTVKKDFDAWNANMKKNIDLTATFIAIDEKGITITKAMFLTLLQTGIYLVEKLEKETHTTYKLSTTQQPVNQKIKKAIIRKARVAYEYFKMEGQKLPEYDFTDLNGISHNKEVRTTGKITVLKSWFINCKVCVEEFPKLNDLVDTYQNEDIQFISLAFNEKEKLKKFLKTKPFKYFTIPNQKKYMSKNLKVKQYPTHIIINSDGVILKVVNNVDTLTSELERILEEENHQKIQQDIQENIQE